MIRDRGKSMNIAIILFNQIIVMFLLMFVGTYLYKKQLVTIEGSKQLGNLLLKIVVPIVILKSFAVEYSDEKQQILIITFILSLFVLLISMIVSHIIYKKDPILNFASSFSNVGFIGIPLVQAVLGDDSVFYITCIVAQLVALQWTYGLMIITKNKDFIKLKNVMINPVVIAFIIGLLIFKLDIQLPNVMMDTFTFMANMNTPLAMIICGIYLGQSNIKKMFTDFSLYKFSLVRLLLIPLLSLVFLFFVPNEYFDIKIAILIAACAPAGANVAVFASAHNKDYKKAVNSVCLSTLLSIIFIPLIILLATSIF